MFQLAVPLSSYTFTGKSDWDHAGNIKDAGGFDISPTNLFASLIDGDHPQEIKQRDWLRDMNKQFHHLNRHTEK